MISFKFTKQTNLFLLYKNKTEDMIVKYVINVGKSIKDIFNWFT